jgi:hypothetical protein
VGKFSGRVDALPVALQKIFLRIWKLPFLIVCGF